MLLAACGIGGGGGGGTMTGPAIDPTGDWEETQQTTKNTCGTAWGPATGTSTMVGESFTLTPDKTGLVVELDGQPCDPNRVLPYSNGTVSASGDTGFFLAGDGCQYKEATSGYIGTFTSDSMFTSEPLTTTYSLDTGTNCTAFSVLPCQVVTVTTAVRCTGCYGGCTLPAGSAPKVRR